MHVFCTYDKTKNIHVFARKIKLELCTYFACKIKLEICTCFLHMTKCYNFCFRTYSDDDCLTDLNIDLKNSEACIHKLIHNKCRLHLSEF